MNNSKVSVIIPTYNGANFIGKAIQSVLEQTYSNFELIVVNDASPDNTTEIISQYTDPRLKSIIHKNNQGVDRARDTGLRASSGEIIAFLDQDDYFHPDKLKLHVEFLEKYPDVGFTYNARFELNYSSETIRNIYRPPHNIDLADLVLWFPIAPSDWVLRRKWAKKLDFISEYSWTGGEIVYLGRLFLDGCKFAMVNRALNYRRHHTKRVFKDLEGGCQSEINAQEKIFNDPRCPDNLVSLKGNAHANIYAFWAYRAFAQQETSLGQDFLRKAVQHKPSVLTGFPCGLVDSFIINCSDDENLDHAELLRKVFNQLPVEMGFLKDQLDWAIARGYFLKGMRAIIWGRLDDGKKHFEQAIALKAKLDDRSISQITQQLIDYEIEFGEITTKKLINRLSPYLDKLGGKKNTRHLMSSFAVNSAFQYYNNEDYSKIPRKILSAVIWNPKCLSNRGVISVFIQSLINLPKKQKVYG